MFTASPYVLEGTNFTIQLDLKASETAHLYIYHSVSACSNVSDMNTSSPIKFRLGERTSYLLQVQNDTFLCAFLVSTNGNITYYIKRDVRFYNFTSLLSNKSLIVKSRKHIITDPVKQTVVDIPNTLEQDVCLMVNFELRYTRIDLNMTLIDSHSYKECIFQNDYLAFWYLVGAFSLSISILIAYFSIKCSCLWCDCTKLNAYIELLADT